MGCAVPAFAQLDSSALRAKFGAPINRETFHMPEGFDLVVDYNAVRQVCKIEAPALMPVPKDQVANSQAMKQRMYDFLLALIPAPMRVEERTLGTTVVGRVSVTFSDYGPVSISEMQVDGEHGKGTLTLRFKAIACQ
jgi:hypothetical protein